MMRALRYLSVLLLTGLGGVVCAEDRIKVASVEIPDPEPHASYRSLGAMLDQYLALRDAGGWPVLSSAGPRLELGDDAAEITVIREILWRARDLAENALGDTLFDGTLERAVQRFQQRHGLTADGIVGPRTRRALATGVEARIKQIQLNLERMRRLPGDLGDRYIWINTAAFRLDVREGDRIPLSMRVIVGRKEHQTPVFAEDLRYLVINPYWHVPSKIARRDLIPALLDNPDYFTQRRIRVMSGWQDDATELDPLAIDWRRYSDDRYLPYKLRQDPGPDNALGYIKFMLPNRYSVYLHDTPGKHLFERSVRAYSSGCVRLEKPLALAQYAMGNTGADGKEIKAIIEAGENTTVLLPEPIKVYMAYQTAWVDTNGDLQFRDDIYERDPALAALMQDAPLPGDDTHPAGKMSLSSMLYRLK